MQGDPTLQGNTDLEATVHGARAALCLPRGLLQTAARLLELWDQAGDGFANCGPGTKRRGPAMKSPVRSRQARAIDSSCVQ